MIIDKVERTHHEFAARVPPHPEGEGDTLVRVSPGAHDVLDVPICSLCRLRVRVTLPTG